MISNTSPVIIPVDAINDIIKTICDFSGSNKYAHGRLTALFGIGVNELRKRTDENGCPFVLFKGTHRLIKRKKFEEYLNKISVW